MSTLPDTRSSSSEPGVVCSRSPLQHTRQAGALSVGCFASTRHQGAVAMTEALGSRLLRTTDPGS